MDLSNKNQRRVEIKSFALKVLKQRLFLIKNNISFGNYSTVQRCEMLIEAFSTRFDKQKLLSDNASFFRNIIPSNKKAWIKTFNNLISN